MVKKDNNQKVNLYEINIKAFPGSDMQDAFLKDYIKGIDTLLLQWRSNHKKNRISIEVVKKDSRARVIGKSVSAV